MYDALIIGLGSAGLMCAARLKYLGVDNFLAVDGNPKAGRKLALTGNGRCNLTNLDLDVDLYGSDDISKVDKVISGFPVSDTLSFFKELGLSVTDQGGLVYPSSMRSASVIDVLRLYIPLMNIRYDTKITGIRRVDGSFEAVFGHDVIKARNVIIATGGCTYKATGSDGSGFALLAGLLPSGVFEPLMPSLVSLKSSDKDIRVLTGLRFKACASLYRDGKIVAREEGEVLFTDYGISGIMIMQLSRFMTGGRYEVSVDLKCDDDLIRECYKDFTDREVPDRLIGVFPRKLTELLIKRGGNDVDSLIRTVHDLKIKISGVNDPDKGQVTKGGVKLSFLTDSLESRDVPGLYVAGEAVNVDGPCGGYNLQWAWSSAESVAQSISRNVRS